MAVKQAQIYMHVRNVGDAIALWQKVFDARELYRLPGPDGRISHAELMFGDAVVMAADEFPEWGAHAPDPAGQSVYSMVLEVDDADAVFAAALEAGCTETQPMKEQFYGYRMGALRDPFGIAWSIGTKTEDLTPDQIKDRFAVFMKEMETGQAG